MAPDSPTPTGGRKWRRKLLAAWLVLLALSHVVAALRTNEVEREPDECALELERIDGGRRVAGGVRIVYRDLAAMTGADAPVLLLLHGSPGGLGDFDALAEILRAHYRVIAPDLPGFGKSERNVPDYSIEAHARYALQLLERLEVERAHVVAFSMGGGVALHLADIAPARVASIGMVSAIGVQELELFGDHDLNHVVHGLQLGLVQLVRWGFPHFGAMDGALLGLSYARNFYDSDQRPLRGLLGRFEAPLLIVHGRRDFLVPYAAAREHHRLAPQSELVTLDASHFLLWTRTAELAGVLRGFIGRAEAGVAATRARATPERVAAAAVPFDPRTIPPATGAALFVLVLLIMAATLVSEDLTCIGAGLLVAQGRVEFVPGVAACFAGIYTGDVLLYFAGRFVGRPAVRHAPLKWVLRPHAIERTSRWFQKEGLKAIFVSRFLPGLRLPMYFSAGLLHTSFLVFALYFFIAAAVWTPILVGLAAWAGVEADRALDLFEHYSLPALLVLLSLLFLVERVGLRLLTRRGRRLLVGAWRRMTHWEFWPPYVFYPPVVLYVLWLALRHRSLALVTAANPGIPTGGFIGESKHAILSSMRDPDGSIPAFVLLRADVPAGERRHRAREFLSERGLSFPVVLKPDVGQRGSGVRIVADARQLERELESTTVDLILQEHAPGLELGIFYYRLPGEERGRLFSITEKRLPAVVGDGRRTLEELILADARAVCMARTYLARNAERLLDVPAAGEAVPIASIGTHCLGAIFLDGGRHATAALEQAIDRIAKGCEGFCFGRLDVRVESLEALREGRGLRVIEVNGLTSEATHIYDPSIRLFAAYRVLFEQWRIAFEIARRNRARGVEPAPLRVLVRELLAYRRLRASHAS